MKTTIPKRSIEVCDFCQHDGYLQRCDVCIRSFCLAHKGTVWQSWGFTQVCWECAQRDDVQAICDRYAKQVTPVFRKRNAALKRLGTNLRKAKHQEAGTEPKP